MDRRVIIYLELTIWSNSVQTKPDWTEKFEMDQRVIIYILKNIYLELTIQSRLDWTGRK